MREADWRLLCGQDFAVWRNGNFDPCFEQLVFGCLPHILLAVVSAFHFGRHQHRRLRGRIVYSPTLHARLSVVIMLIISPIILLLLLYLYEHHSLSLMDVITIVIKAISWLINSGLVWRLHRLHHLSLRGPVEVVVSFVIVLVTSLVQLRTAILHRLYGHDDLTTSEEISTYITTGLHLCCLLTKIPGKRQPVASGLLNVQESFSSEYQVDADTETLVSSEQGQAESSSVAVPEDDAGLFSKLFFLWVQPLMSRGSEGLLKDIDDIPHLPKRLETEKIEAQFSQVLLDRRSAESSEQKDTRKTASVSIPADPLLRNQDNFGEETGPVPEHSHRSTDQSNHPVIQLKQSTSLLGALNKAFGWEYYSLGLLKFLSDGLSFVGPIILNLLVTFMENPAEPSWHGYVYAGLLLISTFLGSMLSTHFNYRICVTGLKLRAALITTVYRKALAVSTVTLSAFNLGEVVNFMSVDTDRIVDFCPSFHQMWSLPVQVGVALYLLHEQVGIAFLAGLAFAVLLIPINRWLAIKIGQLSTRMMLQKDSRVQVINEVLFGIRVVKFCAWEPHFTAKVDVLRKAELDSLKKRKYLDAMCVYFWATTPVLISIITFATYILLGNRLTAAKVFTSIALFGILITPLNAFPWVINGMMEAWVSLKRLQKFINLPELDWLDYYSMDKEEIDSQTAVCLRNCYFSWKSSSISEDDELQPNNSQSNVTCQDETGVLPDRRNLLPLSSDAGNVIPISDAGCVSGQSDTENLLSSATAAETSLPIVEEILNHSNEPGTLRLKNINLTIKKEANATDRFELRSLYKEVHSAPCESENLDLLKPVVFKGSLIGVIGRVGSGKSSLLSALIAEMHKDSGQVFLDCLTDGLGLTLQESWIQQLTVRENILFGRKYEQEKYDQVIKACALVQDLKILPAGDQTEVGESGVTLSGGQKARIALARSVYQEKDMYLLDDPLAAVDAHVAQHLFDQCIMGLLQNTTRILATHHTRFLHQADVILVMDHGQIIKCGDPSILSSELEAGIRVNPANDSEREENTSSNHPTVEVREEGLVQVEEKDSGVVKLHVYKSYWKAVGYCLAFFVLVSLFLMQASRNVADWWLSYWVSHSHSAPPNSTNNDFNLLLASLTDCRYQTSVLMTHSVPWRNVTEASDNLSFYMTVYGSLAGANSVFTLFRAFLFAYSGIAAARTIHQQLLGSIMKAPISFFDGTPIGRIINRFSSDVYSVDDSLPFVLNIFLAQTFGVIGTIVICCYGLPFISILIALLAVVYYFVQKYYRSTSRELKRIASITLSPIYAHFSETVAGLTTIRTLRQTNRFCEENKRRLDSNQRAQFASKAISQWLNIWLQMIGVVMVTGVAIVAVVERDFSTVSPGVVGLAVSYVLSVTNLLSGLVMFFTETEKQMVSVERTSQYINDIPQEDYTALHHAPSSWPHEAAISFHDVCLQYRPGLPNALDGISFDLRPKEKVGIVGRTGSGKSSLFLAMFRLVEINSGQILIDDIDIHSLPLNELRSRLAIIPQDPFLFSGSIRENLDPKNCCSDTHLLNMLKRCHLLEAVQSLGGLDAEVAERGRQFSVGQRQLMCLARALLTKAQVLCIDEATANIDLNTDHLIQQTIQEEFCDKTVLTIAHRLNTVMDSDRILVLSSGKVVEFAEPAYLLQKTDSLFHGFVHNHT